MYLLYSGSWLSTVVTFYSPKAAETTELAHTEAFLPGIGSVSLFSQSFHQPASI